MVGRYLESDLTALSLEVRRGDGFAGLFTSDANPDLRVAVDHALQVQPIEGSAPRKGNTR